MSEAHGVLWAEAHGVLGLGLAAGEGESVTEQAPCPHIWLFPLFSNTQRVCKTCDRKERSSRMTMPYHPERWVEVEDLYGLPPVHDWDLWTKEEHAAAMAADPMVQEIIEWERKRKEGGA